MRLSVTFLLGEKGRRHAVGRRAAARRHSGQEVGGGGLVHPNEEATRLGRVGCLAQLDRKHYG
jgi:hypothetical protein